MFHVVVRTLVGRCAVLPSPDLLIFEASCLASDFNLFPSIVPGPAARPLSCPDEVWRCFEIKGLLSKTMTKADQNITAQLAHLEKWVEFWVWGTKWLYDLNVFSIFCAICYFMFTLLRIVYWCNILNPSITAIYQILYDRTHIIVFDWSVMLNVLSPSVRLKMPWTCLIVTFPKVSRQTNREPVTLTWAQTKVKCDSGDSGWILTGGVLAAIAVMTASKVYQHWR